MTGHRANPRTISYTVDVANDGTPLHAYCMVCDAELTGRDTLDFQLRAHAQKHLGER